MYEKTLLCLTCLVTLGCLLESLEAYATPLNLTVTSTAFKNGKKMPAKQGCNGAGVSPALAWSKVPAGTKSIAIVMVDPQGGPFYHWGTFNISPSKKSIGGNFTNTKANETINDWGYTGYGEACPPGETHAYIFHVVALDATLPPNTNGEYLASDLYSDLFRGSLRSHILAKGSIKGLYYSQG